jgi:hypothetical protein
VSYFLSLTTSCELFRTRLGHETGRESSSDRVDSTKINCRASPTCLEGSRGPSTEPNKNNVFRAPLRVSFLIDEILIVDIWGHTAFLLVLNAAAFRHSVYILLAGTSARDPSRRQKVMSLIPRWGPGRRAPPLPPCPPPGRGGLSGGRSLLIRGVGTGVTPEYPGNL